MAKKKPDTTEAVYRLLQGGAEIEFNMELDKFYVIYKNKVDKISRAIFTGLDNRNVLIKSYESYPLRTYRLVQHARGKDFPKYTTR